MDNKLFVLTGVKQFWRTSEKAPHFPGTDENYAICDFHPAAFLLCDCLLEK
jgi:hypothetical protein